MEPARIDLVPLQGALAMLREALDFWTAEPEASRLRPHLRSAVIQSFDFSYELSLRMLRRVLIERSVSPPAIAELSFADLLRTGADAGLLPDPQRWREWRELRNATSHAYSEAKAQAVAERARGFAVDASALVSALEASLAG